jgi:transcription antitermination factor NusG
VRHRRRPRIAEFPVFWRYIFVCTEDPGRTRMIIRAHSTKVRIMSAGDERGPLEVPYRDVNDLMRREGAGEFDLLKGGDPPPIVFRVGDVVLVSEGLFANRQGIIKGQRNAGRWSVQINGYNALVPGEQLRAVEQSDAADPT